MAGIKAQQAQTGSPAASAAPASSQSLPQHFLQARSRKRPRIGSQFQVKLPPSNITDNNHKKTKWNDHHAIPPPRMTSAAPRRTGHPTITSPAPAIRGMPAPPPLTEAPAAAAAAAAATMYNRDAKRTEQLLSSTSCGRHDMPLEPTELWNADYVRKSTSVHSYLQSARMLFGLGREGLGGDTGSTALSEERALFLLRKCGYSTTRALKLVSRLTSGAVRGLTAREMSMSKRRGRGASEADGHTGTTGAGAAAGTIGIIGTRGRQTQEVQQQTEDECFVCCDGGDLMLCDNVGPKGHCVKVYHVACVQLVDIPEGEWECPWHFCAECGARIGVSGSNAGMQCVSCPTAYCRDHGQAVLESRTQKAASTAVLGRDLSPVGSPMSAASPRRGNTPVGVESPTHDMVDVAAETAVKAVTEAADDKAFRCNRCSEIFYATSDLSERGLFLQGLMQRIELFGHVKMEDAKRTVASISRQQQRYARRSGDPECRRRRGHRVDLFSLRHVYECMRDQGGIYNMMKSGGWRAVDRELGISSSAPSGGCNVVAKDL